MIEDENIDLEQKSLEKLLAMLANPAPEGEPIEKYAEATVGVFHYVCLQKKPCYTEKFVDVVKNNGNMYKVKYPLYDEALVLYYCFKGEYEKAENAFANMRKDPMRNFACYYSCIKLLCAYGRGGFVNRVLNPTVMNKVFKDDNGIDLNMRHIKFIYFLEENYKKSPTNIPVSKFAKFNKIFKLEDNEGLVSSIQGTLFSNNDLFSEEVSVLNHSCEFIDVLRFLFLRYMYDQGVDFLQADIMFGNALEVIDSVWSVLKLKNREIKSDIIFDFKYEDWIKALDRMPYEYMLEVGFCEVSGIWGSVYLYDFLYKEELLSKKQYENFCKTIKKVKRYVIALYLPVLWKFNFVHNWPKPNGVWAEQFDAERIFFEETIFMNNDDPFEDLEKVFEDEKSAEVLDIVKNIKVLERETSLFDKYCERYIRKLDNNEEYSFRDIIEMFNYMEAVASSNTDY
jgi:hypothetical protein